MMQHGILVIIDTDNGMLPDSTDPLSLPQTDHQWGTLKHISFFF